MPAVRNRSRGGVVVSDLRLADCFWGRLRGLLGRPPLAEDQGLWLEPCAAVHTCFLRQAIDVAFLDQEGRVRKIVAGLKPWRAAGARGARVALELPAGRAARARLAAGDVLVREER